MFPVFLHGHLPWYFIGRELECKWPNQSRWQWRWWEKCLSQVSARFSITQKTSRGSKSLPFPRGVCTIITAALLDYLQLLPEGPVRQSQNVLYQGSLHTENSSVPWPSHACCFGSSCIFMLLFDLTSKYPLHWNCSSRFTGLTFPSSSQKTGSSHLYWESLFLLSCLSLSWSFLSNPHKC